MKNRASVIVVLALVFLTACSPPAQTSATKTVLSAFDRILQKGELVVGTAGNMPPLNMTTKSGDIIGLEIDLAKAMAEGMGVNLKLETIPFAKLLSALETGQVDMILSGMTITPERNLKVAFVGPYYVTGKAFLTKIKRIADTRYPSEVNSPDTILTALKGSTSQHFVEKSIPKAILVPANNYDDAVKMVIKGDVDALIADYPICMLSVFRYPDKGLLSLLTPITYEPLGIAIPAGDSHLLNWVENFLNTLKGSGKLEALKTEWFKHGAWLDKLP